MLSRKRIINVKRILILIGILFLCYQISNGQVALTGDKVCMPLKDYRSFRTIILQSDTLRLECDSIISGQDKLIATKDSININLRYKLILKDSIIIEKNRTISQLAIIKKEPKIHKQLWIGTLIGTVFTMLLLR